MSKYLFFILAILLVLAGSLVFILGGKPIANLGNTTENAPVKLSLPIPGKTVDNPIVIQGEALGSWFFEASMLIRVVDANNKTIGQGLASATSNWMTADYVPFTAEIEFQPTLEKTGFLIFEKENPSGLPEYSDEYRIGIKLRS